nr:uncharacterized protein LOC129395882 isoform X3 [Pan paniscus]
MARCPPAAAATTCPAGRPPPPREEEHSQLLPISFQGFRWDYDQDVDTPNRDRLAGEGVKAKYLMPPLVTMTSPSHFTAMPDDRVWIKDWNVASLCPRWKGPQTVVLTTPTAVKVEGIPAWNHHRCVKPAALETWEARPSPDNPCRVTLKKTTSPAPVTPGS